MRRYILYIAVALLSFGIGSFIAFEFYWKVDEPSVSVEKIESVSVTKAEDESFKYGCKEKELVSLWERLNKKTFLEFKELQLRKYYKNFPNSFQSEWKDRIENFSCSDFGYYNKEVDLNGDGQNEIFVSGSVVSIRADNETYIFQEKNGKFEVILYHLSNIEDEVRQSKTKKYSDLVFMTNWSGSGSRMVTHYKFDGKFYKSYKCFSEDHEIRKNGKIVGYSEKAISTRVPCGY